VVGVGCGGRTEEISKKRRTTDSISSKTALLKNGMDDLGGGGKRSGKHGGEPAVGGEARQKNGTNKKTFRLGVLNLKSRWQEGKELKKGMERGERITRAPIAEGEKKRKRGGIEPRGFQAL